MNSQVCNTSIGSQIDKEHLIDILTDELAALRAKLGLTQDELSNIIGGSRQTYSAIETKKRRMSWNIYLSLILFYGFNEQTSVLVEAVGAFPRELKDVLNINNRDRRDNEKL